MADRRTQQLGNKQRGWDNEVHNREQKAESRVREPYDPSKEKLVGEEGRFPVDRNGYAHIVVEYISYNEGPRQVRVRKIGTNRDNSSFATNNIGKLWGDQCVTLAKLLTSAATKLAATTAAVKADR